MFFFLWGRFPLYLFSIYLLYLFSKLLFLIEEIKLVFAIFVILKLIYTAVLQCFDSGKVKYDDESQAQLEKSIKEYWKDLTQLKCKQCKITTCLRAFHCPFNRICVPKFDYFSVLLMKSVGAKNAPLFMGFWFLDVAFLSLLIAFTGMNFYHLFEKRKFWLVLFLGYAGLNFLNVFSLYWTHVKTMLFNLTYFESIAWNRNWVFMNS